MGDSAVAVHLLIEKFAELPGLELVHSSWGSKKPPSQVCGVLVRGGVWPRLQVAEGLAPGCVARTGPLWRWAPLHTPRQGPEERNQEGSFPQCPFSALYCQSPALCQCKKKCLPTPVHYYSPYWSMDVDLRGGTSVDYWPVSQMMLLYSQLLTRSAFCSEWNQSWNQAPLLLWPHLICHLPCWLCGGHPDLPAVSGTYLVGAWPQGLRTRWSSFLAKSFPRYLHGESLTTLFNTESPTAPDPPPRQLSFSPALLMSDSCCCNVRCHEWLRFLFVSLTYPKYIEQCLVPCSCSISSWLLCCC